MNNDGSLILFICQLLDTMSLGADEMEVYWSLRV